MEKAIYSIITIGLILIVAVGAWVILSKKKTDPSLKNNKFLKIKMPAQYIRKKGTSKVSTLKRVAMYELKKTASIREIFESFKSPVERMSFKNNEIDENKQFLLSICEGAFIVLYEKNGKYLAYYLVQHGANTFDLTSNQSLQAGAKVIINCS